MRPPKKKTVSKRTRLSRVNRREIVEKMKEIMSTVRGRSLMHQIYGQSEKNERLFWENE